LDLNIMVLQNKFIMFKTILEYILLFKKTAGLLLHVTME
jgi:hypothetical protein